MQHQDDTYFPETSNMISPTKHRPGRRPLQYRFPMDQIIRFEGNGNYTWIYAQGKPRELLSIHLKKLGQLYPHFRRIHKSHLINPRFIEQERTRTDGYGHSSACLVLADGQRVPWSRRYYQRDREERNINV